MGKKLAIIGVVLVVVVVAIVFGFSKSSSSNEQGMTIHTVERGNVVDKAMAIGQIEPERDIVVKSQISGIVSRAYVEVGDRVEVGNPLFDIAPQPTPIEYAESKRQVELADVTFQNAKRGYERIKGLFEKNLISESELEDSQQAYEEAKVRLASAREKLSLIQEGKTNIAGREVENVIRAPISGVVLQRFVDEGDPVVPLTSYQQGTELMALAAMDSLIFRGTVDEIDVGKLQEGMNVQLQIGAIPNDTIYGMLYKISPKARKQDNTTVFDVEVRISSSTGNSTLRAGYSANAEIIVDEKNEVLVVPERLITFRSDSTFVDVRDSIGTIAEMPVEIGLSDGITVEIVSGLSEGQEIVEKPPKTIE